MAPGIRTPNGRKLTNECAGLSRDLSTELPAKTIARLRAVFCLPATAEIAAKHQTQEHWSQAFNARSMRGFGMEAKPQWKRRRRACDC